MKVKRSREIGPPEKEFVESKDSYETIAEETEETIEGVTGESS